MIPSPNVSNNSHYGNGCRQCLPLSVFQLKGKYCRKPHCPNGVVDTIRHKLSNWFDSLEVYFQGWKLCLCGGGKQLQHQGNSCRPSGNMGTVGSFTHWILKFRFINSIHLRRVDYGVKCLVFVSSCSLKTRKNTQSGTTYLYIFWGKFVYFSTFDWLKT